MPFSDRKRRPIEVNIVPLINVVFLLLIFFMVSGQAVNPNEAEVDVPYSAIGNTAPDTSFEIALLEDGILLLNNKPIAPDAALQLIENELLQSKATPIRIKAAATAKAQDLTRLMRNLRVAGALNLTIATQSPISVN